MPPAAILNPADFPTKVLHDQTAIRERNLQRFEMEQLSAITLIDENRKLIVGYRDLAEDEFWARGHMPGFPLMPGVLMCEAAAQLSSFYCHYFDLVQGDFVGFGGMDNVRFRGMVRPGERFWLAGQTDRHSPRRMKFAMQGFVGERMVFHGDFIGISMSRQGNESESDD